MAVTDSDIAAAREFYRRQKRLTIAIFVVLCLILASTISTLTYLHVRARRAEALALEQKTQMDELAEAAHLRWDMRTERHLNRDELISEVTGATQKKVIDLAIDLYERQPPIAYTWGGKSPNAGFDSSGFIAYILFQAGLPTNPSTFWSGRLKQFLKPVPLEDKRPGDVVFYPGGTCMLYLGGPDHLSIGALPGGIATGQFERFAQQLAVGRF